MKKLLLLLTLLVFTIPIIAQDPVTDVTQNVEAVSEYVTDGDVEKLVDKYSAKIEASIVALAETLQQPAEYVYKVLIKQQKVHAYTWLWVDILLLVITLAFWILLIFDFWDNGDEWYGIPIFFLIVFVIVLCCTINMIVGGFINPEYGAIKDIANLIPK